MALTKARLLNHGFPVHGLGVPERRKSPPQSQAIASHLQCTQLLACSTIPTSLGNDGECTLAGSSTSTSLKSLLITVVVMKISMPYFLIVGVHSGSRYAFTALLLKAKSPWDRRSRGAWCRVSQHPRRL